jgi:O-methyltransferase
MGVEKYSKLIKWSYKSAGKNTFSMKKNRIRGRLKGYFFVLRLHRLFPPNILSFFSHLAALSGWIMKHRKTGYSDFYSRKFDYARRYVLYRHLIETEKLNGAIDYIEFGVSKGDSFKWWAGNITNAGARFYGFDTFTGLPEDWGSFKKGDMTNNNEPPVLDDRRCKFYQGLFQQTLPGFINTYSPNNRRVIHMDADLYSSTLYALTSVAPLLKKGDIIIFDEFNVPMHEFKAFIEWTESYYIKYEVLGAVNNFYQVAVKMTM